MGQDSSRSEIINMFSEISPYVADAIYAELVVVMMAGIANDAAGGKFQGELGDDVVDAGEDAENVAENNVKRIKKTLIDISNAVSPLNVGNLTDALGELIDSLTTIKITLKESEDLLKLVEKAGKDVIQHMAYISIGSNVELVTALAVAGDCASPALITAQANNKDCNLIEKTLDDVSNVVENNNPEGSTALQDINEGIEFVKKEIAKLNKAGLGEFRIPCLWNNKEAAEGFEFLLKR